MIRPDGIPAQIFGAIGNKAKQHEDRHGDQHDGDHFMGERPAGRLLCPLSDRHSVYRLSHAALFCKRNRLMNSSIPPSRTASTLDVSYLVLTSLTSR